MKKTKLHTKFEDAQFGEVNKRYRLHPNFDYENFEVERTVEYDPDLRHGEREVVAKSYISERTTLNRSKEKRQQAGFYLYKYVLHGKEFYSRRLFANLELKKHFISEIVGEPLYRYQDEAGKIFLSEGAPSRTHGRTVRLGSTLLRYITSEGFEIIAPQDMAVSELGRQSRQIEASQNKAYREEAEKEAVEEEKRQANEE